MKSPKWLVVVLGLNLAAIFAAGVWLRFTSLETAPDPHADEAFFGVQAGRLLRGDRLASATRCGNPLNLPLIGMQAALLPIAGTSYTALRLASAISGTLAIVATYWLGARVLDRTTAVIAAALVAVLPIAIIFSRIGWDPCQMPLCSMLGLYFGLRGHRGGTLLAYLLGIATYHAQFMIAPILTLVLLVQFHRTTELPTWRRLTTSAVIVGVAAGLVLGMVTWERTRVAYQMTNDLVLARSPSHLWGRFLTLYKKMLLGFCMGAPTHTSRLHGWAFWGIVGAVGGLGTWRLARQRRWDRLALVAAVVLTLAGMNLVLGPGVLDPALVRYGLFLVVPSALAFACLLRGLLVAPTDRRRAAVRGLQVAAMLGGAYVLLIGAKANWFDAFAARLGGRENYLTLGSECEEPKRAIARAIERDLRPGPRRIACEGYHEYVPLLFYLGGRPGLKVGSLEYVVGRRKVVRDRLLAGDYVVGSAGGMAGAFAVAAAPGDGLRHWHMPGSGRGRTLIYRLRRADEPVLGPCECGLARVDEPGGRIRR